MLITPSTSAQSNIIELTPLYVIEESAFDLAWSYDGRYLAAAGREVFIWDTETRTIITRFECYHGHGSQQLSWHPNQLILAAGCEYEGEFVETLPINDELTAVRFNSYNQAVAWSPDGNQIAVVQHDSTVGILDASFELLYALGEPYYPPTYQPGEIPEVDTGPGQTIDLKWSPDSKYLTETSRGQGTVLEIWDLVSKQVILWLRGASGVNWKSEGSSLTFAADQENDIERSIQSWVLSPPSMTSSFTIPIWRAWGLEGTQYVAYCGEEFALSLYDTSTLQSGEVQNKIAPEEIILCPDDDSGDIAWSAHGLLATTGRYGLVSIWRIES